MSMKKTALFFILMTSQTSLSLAAKEYTVSPDVIDVEIENVDFKHVVTTEKGYFDEDRNEDIAIVADFVSRQSEVTHEYNPWEESYGCAKREDIRRSIIMVHKSDQGVRDVHVLRSCGELDDSRMKIYATSNKPEWLDFPKEVKDSTVLLVVPTGAGIDTYLYWNGEKYKFFAPEEEP